MVKEFAVRPSFTLHLGKSIYKSGEVVRLDETQAFAHAHQIEPWPLSEEAVAARRPAIKDINPRQYVVRPGFVLWLGDKMFSAGETVTAMPGDAVHIHQIEPAEHYHSPVPAATEDALPRPWIVRPGFTITWREEICRGGSVIHFTDKQAQLYSHMIEPAPKGAGAISRVVAEASAAALRPGRGARRLA